MLPDDDNYCVCCGDHLATVTWQGMRICTECKCGFDGRNNSALGEVVRRLCQDDPERLETWADGVRDMWDGDAAKFMRDIAAEIRRQEAEHEMS